MPCWTRRLRYTGSASIGRTWAAARRGILVTPAGHPAPRTETVVERPASLLGLHAVLRARLLAVADAGGIERSADHLVPETRQILDATAAHEHNRVLLQVVALAGDVGADLHAVGQADTGDLAKRRV